MIDISKERLIIRKLEATMKKSRAKGMGDEQTALEIYKDIVLPLYNDVRDEWVALLKSSDGKLN